MKRSELDSIEKLELLKSWMLTLRKFHRLCKESLIVDLLLEKLEYSNINLLPESLVLPMFCLRWVARRLTYLNLLNPLDKLIFLLLEVLLLELHPHMLWELLDTREENIQEEDQLSHIHQLERCTKQLGMWSKSENTIIWSPYNFYEYWVMSITGN